MALIGLQLFSAINTGTLAAPVFDEIGPIKDETLNLTKALVDITTRQAKGWRLQQGTLKEASLDFQMVYDAADTDFITIRDAFLADNTQVLMAISDGDLTVAGTYQVFQAAMNITNFTLNRNLEDAYLVDVTAVPTLEAVTNTAPSFGAVVIP